ncbi:MAG: sulfite exporter TauE/SafE family protein [Deltaproteobacteria bacterium]|nr:sulfite exporter TauE/SafE family protein [Deltaproteobacteria bacterium]
MSGSIPIVGSALVLGFAGSVHCIGMCGGIAGALAQLSPRPGPAAAATRSLLHSAGRIASYATAGAAAGAFGQLFAFSDSALLPIRVLLGLVIVGIGLQIGLTGRAAPALERAGQAIWRRLSPLTRRIGRPEHAWQIFAMGVVWGWLPCGLVYSALLLAAGSGEPATGALAMAAFGIGTLPAVLAASGLAAALARLGGALAVRRSAGALLVAFGLWSVIGTWAMAGAHAGHGMPGHDGAHAIHHEGSVHGAHAVSAGPEAQCHDAGHEADHAPGPGDGGSPTP